MPPGFPNEYVLELSVRNAGEWDYPRGQHMLEFVRLAEPRAEGSGS